MRLTDSVIRYAIVSAASFAISFGTPILLKEGFAVAPQTGVAVGLTIVFFFNFLAGKFYIYRSSGNTLQELLSYAVINAAFRAAEYGCFILLYLGFGMKYYVANFLVIASSLPIKFLVYRSFVYTARSSRFPR